MYVFECAQQFSSFHVWVFCYNSCSYFQCQNSTIMLFITIKTFVLFSSVGWVVLLWIKCAKLNKTTTVETKKYKSFRFYAVKSNPFHIQIKPSLRQHLMIIWPGVINITKHYLPTLLTNKQPKKKPDYIFIVKIMYMSSIQFNISGQTLKHG